jgi:hypothetical protein
VQTFKHHWKFSREVSLRFLASAGLSPDRTIPCYGRFLRPFEPVLRLLPEMCTTHLFLGRKPESPRA